MLRKALPMENDGEHTPGRGSRRRAARASTASTRIREAAGECPPTSSAARSATCCSATGRATSTSSSRARSGRSPSALGGETLSPRALRHRNGSRRRPRRLAARAPSPTRSGRVARRPPARRWRRPGAARLHRQRDGDPAQGEARLIDPHGGRGDLERGGLRVLHDRSFTDDPTRALRAARYAAPARLRRSTPDTEALVRETDLGPSRRIAARRSWPGSRPSRLPAGASSCSRVGAAAARRAVPAS